MYDKVQLHCNSVSKGIPGENNLEVDKSGCTFSSKKYIAYIHDILVLLFVPMR